MAKRYRVLHELISFPDPSFPAPKMGEPAKKERHAKKDEVITDADLKAANLPCLIESGAIEEDRGASSVSLSSPAAPPAAE